MTDTVFIDEVDTDSSVARTIEYHFFAEGRRCKMEDSKSMGMFEGILVRDKVKPGEEVYLLKYDEGLSGAYTLGWVVIYDVERLFSEVFNERESVIPKSAVLRRSKDIMRYFLKLLDEKNIRYGEDFINMD